MGFVVECVYILIVLFMILYLLTNLIPVWPPTYEQNRAKLVSKYGIAQADAILARRRYRAAGPPTLIVGPLTPRQSSAFSTKAQDVSYDTKDTSRSSSPRSVLPHLQEHFYNLFNEGTY